MKFAAMCLVVFGCPVLLAGQSPAKNPLHRDYRGGEKLVYRMQGLNENWKYTIQADGVVKKDTAGKYFEEYQWSRMESDGQSLPLRADMAGFRQRLTLDPDQNQSIPDLTKVDPKMIGPIMDFMTFYADVWLAIKTGQLAKAGDHFYFRNPMPATSWADGTRTLIGESAIDFDMTLNAVNAAEGTAELVVRHVPPEKAAVKLPAAWMQAPVGDKPNNWVGVTKNQDGTYSAAVGQETFEVRLKLSLADGKILSATMDNPVKTIERTCTDAAFDQCGPPKPHVIIRTIEISLQNGESQ
jgi:hypothetical protein